MNEKIYVGTGKADSKYPETYVHISLDMTAIKAIYKEHVFKSDKGNEYLSLTVAKKREKDQYGKTHYVTLRVMEENPAKQKEAFEDQVPF